VKVVMRQSTTEALTTSYVPDITEIEGLRALLGELLEAYLVVVRYRPRGMIKRVREALG